MLKKKLQHVLKHGSPPGAKLTVTQEQIHQSNFMRQKVQEWINVPLGRFLKTAASFDLKHGMAYKILKTTPERLKESTLCSHDIAFWLRNYKRPTAAAWIIRLAGPENGQVSRNQLLQWLEQQGRKDEQTLFYKWSKKWGFQDTEYTASIMANPSTIKEARKLYKAHKADSKQAFGNKLLDQQAKVTGKEPLKSAEEYYKFFRTLPKDVITFQIMLSAMVRHAELRQYLDEVWRLTLRQESNNNIKIDDKLRETYERVVKLARSTQGERSASNPGAATVNVPENASN